MPKFRVHFSYVIITSEYVEAPDEKTAEKIIESEYDGKEEFQIEHVREIKDA